MLKAGEFELPKKEIMGNEVRKVGSQAEKEICEVKPAKPI